MTKIDEIYKTFVKSYKMQKTEGDINYLMVTERYPTLNRLFGQKSKKSTRK